MDGWRAPNQDCLDKKLESKDLLQGLRLGPLISMSLFSTMPATDRRSTRTLRTPNQHTSAAARLGRDAFGDLPVAGQLGQVPPGHGSRRNQRRESYRECPVQLDGSRTSAAIQSVFFLSVLRNRRSFFVLSFTLFVVSTARYFSRRPRCANSCGASAPAHRGTPCAMLAVERV